MSSIALPSPLVGKKNSAFADLLRIPPFPGSSARAWSGNEETGAPPAQAGEVLAALRRNRVGGSYWAAQPPLPKRYRLVTAPSATVCDQPGIVRWLRDPAAKPSDPATIVGECDPWHMLDGAESVITAPGDEVGLIAAMRAIPVYWAYEGGGEAEPAAIDPAEAAQALGRMRFNNPFTGEAMDALEAIGLCGFWRRLIDSNRSLDAGLGFAFWKQDNVAPLLWGGDAPLRFIRSAGQALDDREIAVWRSRADPAEVAALERRGAALVEVEDGFLRSKGLGADCVPPLSLTVDRHGAYFDPAQPSELEILITRGGLGPDIVDRARRLRQLIVESGLGKYGHGHVAVARRGGEKRHILVPGQVEDDRSIMTGGSGLQSNLELLRRVRQQAPDAYILYKPHPDVVAGHRKGAIPQSDALRYADEIASDAPIASLIALVDEVHVNTSLAGFEALLRDTPVTTYGVPFYAGWGLTRDLGPVPARRTARPSIDELVAATLLIYPRYLDPISGLPCPVEVVVDRLITGGADTAGWVVGLRRLQGRLTRGFRALVG